MWSGDIQRESISELKCNAGMVILEGFGKVLWLLILQLCVRNESNREEQWLILKWHKKKRRLRIISGLNEYSHLFSNVDRKRLISFV